MLLDKLLSNLSVHVDPFALCTLGEGWRLHLPGPSGLLFHFVLKGHGMLYGPNSDEHPIFPLHLAVVPIGAEKRTSREEEPRYGGTLNVATHARSISAMSWDPADWNWKQNHDTGMYFEQLFAADLDKSTKKGGPYPFTMQAFLPADAIRGELAESWEWEDPLTLAIRLRRGVMIPDKPGVMKGRELVADDVVFSFERQKASPKIIG